MSRQRRKGQVLVLVTVSLLAMAGMLGLAVDLGWSYYVKKTAQSAADAAALAAVKAAYDVVGQDPPYICGQGLTCQATPAPCPSSLPSIPTNNLEDGCLYAQQHGFTVGSNGGRQNVVMSADTTPEAPTAPGIKVFYWATARVSESVPQLFSSLLGNTSGVSSARATAAIADVVVIGSLYALNRENDPSANGTGVDIFTQGGGTIDAGGGVFMASTASGANGTYTAGHAGGSATVEGSFISIRGAGEVDNPSNFIPTPQNGFADTSDFKDPMRGKGQPAAPATGLPEMQVSGGTISGNCNNPTVLAPGRYYATGTSGKKGGGATVATGQPISITGCVTLSAGTSGFGDYVFYGGLSFPSTHTTVTFSPGRYVVSGALSGNPVFYMHNGVVLQDQTPLDGNGKPVQNTDAGGIFVFTDTHYPGLEVPSLVQAIEQNLQYGMVDIQMGNTDASLVNLHGLNKQSDAVPDNLKTFAPTLFWQDQANSQVLYTPDGNIDYTSCGSGHTINNPCFITSTRIDPEMHMQAHPNLHLWGVVYQPRGASLTFQGHGTMETPMQLITGTVETQGGPTVMLLPVPNFLARRIVALIE